MIAHSRVFSEKYSPLAFINLSVAPGLDAILYAAEPSSKKVQGGMAQSAGQTAPRRKRWGNRKHIDRTADPGYSDGDTGCSYILTDRMAFRLKRRMQHAETVAAGRNGIF